MLSPCENLNLIPWLFWKSSFLILLPQTEATASELNLNINSRIYHLGPDQIVSEIYKIKNDDPSVVWTQIGRLNSTQFLTDIKDIWERRSNLSRIHLTVVYANYKPILSVQLNPLKFDGYFGELFSLLQEDLKFTFSLVEEKAWGLRLDNGSYTGMIGALQRGESNWSISDYNFTPERKKVIDFSTPIVYRPKRIVMRRPVDDLNWTAYADAFAIDFWILILLSTLTLSVCLYNILKREKEKRQKTFVEHSEVILSSTSFVLLSLCCRDISSLKSRCSGKVLMFVILCWGFLICSAFNAVLTSVLTVSKLTVEIRSLEDLLNSERLQEKTVATFVFEIHFWPFPCQCLGYGYPKVKLGEERTDFGGC